MPPLPPPPRNVLPYRRPRAGRDYWITDGVLPNAEEVHQRCASRTDWSLGAPYRPETWPGMRAPLALTLPELAKVEEQVKALTGARSLEQRAALDGGALSHNHVQLVGEQESGPRPHVDSLKLCNLAAVIYLTPRPPPGRGGTAFYRLRLAGGVLGGNAVAAPHSNLVDALGVRRLPAEAWAQDLEIENRFNRLLLYKSDLVHSAASYFGRTLREKRMTALFFWMAKLTVLVLWALSLAAAPAVSTRVPRRAGRGMPRLSQRAARRGVAGAGWLEETTSPRTRRLGQRGAVRLQGARPRPSNRLQQPARAAAERPRRVYGPGHWNQRSGADVRVTSPQPEPHGQPRPTPLA